jgi:hypothetical protein
VMMAEIQGSSRPSCSVRIQSSTTWASSRKLFAGQRRRR